MKSLEMGIIIAVVIMGVIFFIIGIAILKNRNKKEIKCTLKTYGKVIDIVKEQSRDWDDGYSFISWHPVFEYNIGELKFVKEYLYGSSQPQYVIGQEVEIYYNPENYNDFYISGENLPNKIGTIFTIVGVTIIIIGIFSGIILL